MLHGKNIIGASLSGEGTSTYQAVNPTLGTVLTTVFYEATPQETDRALNLAREATQEYSWVAPIARAAFLEAVADALLELGEPLVHHAMEETGLPQARLQGELGRTVGQIRQFAGLLREGSWVEATITTAQPERQPLPRPDLRSMLVPMGPVAVFGASNFPLAFSVAGGDTASALAAGCPVVCKAHPAHPATSELAGMAIQKAVATCQLPQGTFSLLHGRSHAVGAALVMHPAIRAVGFTGSFAGGKALADLAAQRPEPIPVFAEMGSTNPIFILPEALATRHAAIAQGLVASVTLGTGQFCTNPGIFVLPVAAEGASQLLDAVALAVKDSPAGTMLTANIQQGYEQRVGQWQQAGAATIGTGLQQEGKVQAAVCRIPASTALENPLWVEEVFGPASLAITAESKEEILEFARAMPGQLTATLHGTEKDLEDFADLVAILRDKAGRLVFNGFPTGVEVAPAMVHGGPFPATTDSRFTSVGTTAIRRFVRPVCYQNFPDAALPEALKKENPLQIWRKVDGDYTKNPV
jgi:NADP-dependent aldehyde dehydrogenase